MKHQVQVREQVRRFIGRLAPETRKKIRKALRELETEQKDCLPLREKFAGYHRLRIGGYRIVFRYQPGRIIDCVFAEERSLVYHLFDREMLAHLRHETK
jgi:mRNA-degrading endonuclease RelE of RelBE toxin-antitoxin system